MGNSIRWLKQEISVIPINTAEEECKAILVQKIDEFINERITLADKLIVDIASKHIGENFKILTFGFSNVLMEVFEYCATVKLINFEIYIIDSRPLFEGKKIIQKLNKYSNIKLHYNLINSVSSVLEKSNIDYCMIGAHSMLSNGRLYSRVGTALITMTCKNKNIPVLILCESLKFSDKVQLDSVTLNELGDSDDLVNTIKPLKKTGFNLQSYIKDLEIAKLEEDSKKKKQQNQNKKDKEKEIEVQKEGESDLSNWKSFPTLNILNVLYDLTPPEYIEKIITEFGALPASSVPVILREYKNGSN